MPVPRAPGLLILLVFLLFAPAAQAEELILSRNVVVREPVDPAQIAILKKQPAAFFRPGDRIVAVYVFEPAGSEKFVEFRWIQQMGRSAGILKESTIHRLNQANPGGTYVAYSWVLFDPSLFDKLLGSGYSGNWVVEVLIDGRKRVEKQFLIGHD